VERGGVRERRSTADLSFSLPPFSRDTIYSAPFVGKPAVQAYFAKAAATLGAGTILFVVDGVSPSPDGRAAGVKWHVELDDGTPLPNSRGVSYYDLDGDGRITGGRDFVEPAIKTGSATLGLLAAIVPLVRAAAKAGKGGKAAALAAPESPPPRPSSLTLTPAAAAVWALYAGYVAAVFFSRALPGVPVLETPPDVLAEVFDESLNFFFVNPALHSVGISFLPDPARPPPSEALFNFVNAWSLLFLPAMLADRRSAPLGDKAVWGQWLGVQFLTNVFMPPYLVGWWGGGGEGRGGVRVGRPTLPASPPTPLQAVRPMTAGDFDDGDCDIQPSSLPPWAPAVGAVAAAVGAACVPWALCARPEFGGLDARADAAVAMLTTNRASFAFALDACLYSVWQAALLRGAPARFRFVPFFGLAAFYFSAAGGVEAGE